MMGVMAAPKVLHPARRFNSGKILVAHPNLQATTFRTLEDTGYGNLLCYESYGSRPFLSSEEEVRAGVKRFVDEYIRLCKQYDEEPKHDFCEVMNWNDLYAELHILPSTFGDEWGLSVGEDYRITPGFNIYMMTNTVGTYFQNMSDKVLFIDPLDQYCTPYKFYLEV